MRHLLGVRGLDRTELTALLDLTASFREVQSRPIPKVPALQGRTVATLFFEDSTRTRLSFETAAKRLSADTLSFSVGTSSVNKGESLKDTARTIEAMGVDAIVVRHGASGAPWQLARWVDAAIVNGGDGWHEHPTQALLDAFTLRTRFGSLDGLRVAIVGDIAHSRVARSNVWALTTLGAEVTLVAPRTLLPPDTSSWPVRITDDLDAVLPDVDVVYLLRMQFERQGAALVPSLAEYVSRFGLTRRRAETLGAGAVVLHPGPMNQGVEIAAEVVDDPRCLVLDQVANGVSVRMAVLFRLLGAGPLPDAGGVADV
jgi:aspartate carbamoyltransferase catalytic subunit